MKKIAFLVVVLAFTFLITSYKQAHKQIAYHELQIKTSNRRIELIRQQAVERAEQAKAKAVEEAAIAAQTAQEQAQNKREEPPSIPASYGTSCTEAIAQAFPSQLQAGAQIVLAHENGSGNPNAIGSVNRDGSQDFGCFQINNHSHPQFFATQDWRDPVANAKYAYQIYADRGNWTAWYAVQGILW